MTINLIVETKQLGQRKRLVPEWGFALDAVADQPSTLRGLIGELVKREVSAYNERQLNQVQQRILGFADIERGVRQGKITLGGRPAQLAEIDIAIDTAVQAFKDGLFFVFLNENQIMGLDESLQLSPDTHILILRLVALAGG